MGVFLRPLLSINTTPLRLQMASPLGEHSMRWLKASMERTVTKSELSVATDPMEIDINYDEVSASLGHLNPTQKKEKIVSESKQAVLKVIGEICQNGDRMMKTQGRAYADICQAKFLRDPYRLEQVFIPAAPTIRWSGTGTTKVDFTPYSHEIKWNIPLKPEVEYQVGKPDISVSQWHKVDIAYNGTLSDVVKIGLAGARKLYIEV